MTEPQEYIITEDELVEVFAFLENPPMYDVPEFTLEIEQRVRSRPAKESSDMLDELEKRVEENGSIFLQASTFLQWMKELRTKEREIKEMTR